MRRIHGFTLIELLVVVGIVALVLGAAVALPIGQEGEAQVRGAAHELAAVLRETRARAIRDNASFAVAFHIQNAPGSSGRVLNNRSGGHWYRVLGPGDTMMGYNRVTDNTIGRLPLFDLSRSMVDGDESGNRPALRPYLELVARSWIGEPIHLPQGEVRFLALTDQDNGDNDAPAAGGYYSATYPRPWFGWWDDASGRLYTWGGYDPELKSFGQYFDGWSAQRHTTTVVNGRQTSATGFRYEGWEGEVVGCVHPVDRLVLDDVDGDGLIGDAEVANPTLYPVSRKGEPRPLIDADWLDFLIIFRPDGRVVTDWFRLRNAHWDVWPYRRHGGPDPYVPTFPSHDYEDLGVADRCNGMARRNNWADRTTAYRDRSRYHREATDYVDRTGFYWITLAGDVAPDAHTFASAEDALDSLGPIYRVGVSPEGVVRVIRVSRSYHGSADFDRSIVGDDWEVKTKIWGKAEGPPRSGSDPGTWHRHLPITDVNYVNHRLHEADGSPRGMPVQDVVLPEMLRERMWWWATP